MKYLTLLLLPLLFIGCGSNKTYVDSGPAVPDVPTEGNVLIVEASDNATGVISYTEVGDGSILVTCGDGDNYDCIVSLGDLQEGGGDEGASTTGSCSDGDTDGCPNN